MFARLILAFLLTSSVAWAQHADDVFVGQKAPELKSSETWISSHEFGHNFGLYHANAWDTTFTPPAIAASSASPRMNHFRASMCTPSQFAGIQD